MKLHVLPLSVYMSAPGSPWEAGRQAYRSCPPPFRLKCGARRVSSAVDHVDEEVGRSCAVPGADVAIDGTVFAHSQGMPPIELPTGTLLTERDATWSPLPSGA